LNPVALATALQVSETVVSATALACKLVGAGKPLWPLTIRSIMPFTAAICRPAFTA
jgi:hypothetical protein